MRELLKNRLKEMHEELETGRGTLEALEERSKTVHSQMLRISGAIQVLEELLESESDAPTEQQVGASANAAASSAHAA